MKIFEDAKTKTLPEELINATDPQFKHWVDNVLKDNKRFPCINPMTKFRTLETEPLKIEDRDDVVGPPPRRTYRVPQATRTIKTFLRRNGKPRLDTTFQIGMVFPSSYIEEAERWLEILSRFTRRKRTNQTNIVLHARHARMLATITECQNLKYLRSGSRILAIESGQRIANENSICNTIRKLRVQGCSNGLDIKCPLFSTGFGRNYAKSRHSIWKIGLWCAGVR